MNITVNYTVTISDDVTVQNALKALLDEQLDVAGAGGNYLARFKAALKKYGTNGLRTRLTTYRQNTAVATMRATQTALAGETTVGDGIDN